MKLSEKIKSVISLRGLLFRAVVFGAAWLWLPFWLFLIIALYLYLAPLFRPAKFALPFLILLIFAAIEPPNVWLAVLFSSLFYLILGIKDLILIERRSAYEILVLTMFFFMAVKFFSRFDNWGSGAAFFYAALFGAVSFFLARDFLDYSCLPDPSDAYAGKRRDIFSGLLALMVWQFSLAALFLPLNFWYQSAIIFLAASVFLELGIGYLGKKSVRRASLVGFSVFFVVLVIILGSANWTP
jgi:hypothetical protein